MIVEILIAVITETLIGASALFPMGALVGSAHVPTAIAYLVPNITKLAITKIFIGLPIFL